MAVQAQYPSHVLFLNRNEQERKNMEYSLQAQAAGFLDQSSSAIFFSSPPFNGESSNTRKRGREATVAPINTTITTTTNTPLHQHPVNLFSLQPQQPSAAPPPTTTLINLSQLHTQPTTLVSTGLRLSFEDHNNHQQRQQHQQTQGNPFLSSFLTEDLAAEIKHQKDEIDHFLRSQGDQLRRTLAESRRRHYRALLGLAEESAARRLREKQAEAESAAHRNAELLERVARLRAESMTWQVKARAEEAAAAALQAQLQQAAAAAQDHHNRGEEPGCCGETPAPDDAVSAYVDPDRRDVAGSSGPVCRACRRRVVGVVLLPCRHLCLCRECGAAAEACPVCLCVRSACVEVFLS